MSASDVKEICKKCQENWLCHEKLLKKLKNVYDKVPYDEFFSKITSVLKFILREAENSPAYERVSTFLAKFVISFEKSQITQEEESDASSMHPFVTGIFDFLIQFHKCAHSVVRYRVCYLLNKLLTEFGTEASITEDVFTDLLDMAIDRILDRSAMVRVQAVLVSSWLQEPTNPNCPVVEAYLFHLSHDTNHIVRRTILAVIATTPKTLGPIMGRIRDINEGVRKAAYTYLAEKVPVRMLSIAQRIKLLTQGLNDRSVKVKTTVENKLLSAWMRTLNNSVEEFLHSMDVQSSSEICEQALIVLFKAQEPVKLIKEFEFLDANHVIPYKQLTCEIAFHWRCLCQYIRSLDGPIVVHGFDELVPDLTPFCEYMKSYILMTEEDWSFEKVLDHEFVSFQLLTIASKFDMADEVGRKNLFLLVKDLLVSPKVTYSLLIKLLVAIYKKLHEQPTAFMSELIEIISEIREPIILVEKHLDSEVIHAFKIKIANITVELNILRDQQENCIANQDFVEAQNLKVRITDLEEKKTHLENQMLPEPQEVRVQHSDSKTVIKCLTVVAEMLQTDERDITPPLQAVVETLVLPGIQNEDPLVRNEAVKALGLFCLRSADAASQHLLLFMQISQMDQEEVRATALRAVFDMFLFYGLDAFQPDVDQDLTSHAENESASRNNSQEHATSQILSVLTTFLDCNMQEVRSVVAEGIGKLIHLGRIYSPELFSRLIVLWYNPITEDDVYLRHFIGVFVLEYSGCGRARTIDCVEEAFLLTLRTVCNAPASSPLSSIDQWNLATFLIQISHPKVCKQNETVRESTIHDRVALQLCNEILKDPNCFHVRLFSKILNHLELTKHHELRDLSVMAQEISQVVKDKQSLNSIEKLLLTLEKLKSESASSSQSAPSEKLAPRESSQSEKHPVSEGTVSEICSAAESITCTIIESPIDNVLSTNAMNSNHMASSENTSEATLELGNQKSSSTYSPSTSKTTSNALSPTRSDKLEISISEVTPSSRNICSSSNQMELPSANHQDDCMIRSATRKSQSSTSGKRSAHKKKKHVKHY